MRYLAISAFAIAAALVAPSETAAQPPEEPPLPLVIEDDGTVRMHGDTLVVRPDGTVSMGDFEFSSSENGDLSIGHRDSEQRLRMEKSGAIIVGKGSNQGISLGSDGSVQIGYGKAGFFAWPSGDSGSRDPAGNTVFSQNGNGELLFNREFVTGMITVRVEGSQKIKTCYSAGSGGCNDQKSGVCAQGRKNSHGHSVG